jgi:hypothetical protein
MFADEDDERNCVATLPESLVVFGRYDNLKRAIALLGVMLALSSVAMDARLLCRLGECAVFSNEDPCSEHASCETDPCGHLHTCETGRAASPPSWPDDSVDDGAGACPCPPSCLCQQMPQPLELPRSTSEPTESLLENTMLCHTPMAAATEWDPTSSHDWAAARGASTESAKQRCVKLCRLLI